MTTYQLFLFVMDHAPGVIAWGVFSPCAGVCVGAAWYEVKYREALRLERRLRNGGI